MSTETMALTLENVEKVLDEPVSYTHLTLPTTSKV